MEGIYAIVLAAGSGARFGGGKLLAPWRGGVLLDGALDAAVAAPVRGVVVVTGAQADRVSAVVRDRGMIVHVADYAEGMAASLRAGIAALPQWAAGALIFLGDMPLVPHAILPPLVNALLDGAPAAAPVCQGRRGNPVALSARLFSELLRLKGDQGARRILEGLGADLVLIETRDSGVLVDVDRPSDMPA